MLDTSSEVQERLGEIKIYPLQFGEAGDVASMLEDMVERMLALNPKPGLTSYEMVRLIRIWPMRILTVYLFWSLLTNWR